MKTAKQQREVRQIEMIKTYNLAASLKRLNDAPGYDTERWKRALNHAIQMSHLGCTVQDKTDLRIALKLP